MTGIGWDFWDLKFSWFIVMFVSAILFVYVWAFSRRITKSTYAHVDGMAGDEGED